MSASVHNIFFYSIAEYLVPTPPVGTSLEEPICRGDLPASMHTLDHLAGIRHRHLLPHFPEMGLREALQTLTDRTPVSVDLMATRIARSLVKVRLFTFDQCKKAYHTLVSIFLYCW